MVCDALQWTEERDEEFVSDLVVVVEMEVVKEVLKEVVEVIGVKAKSDNIGRNTGNSD